MTVDVVGTIKIPAGRVGVIRALSYSVNLLGSVPFVGFEPLFGTYNFSVQVDGVNAEGIPLNPSMQNSWPQFLYDLKVFIICPERSTVSFRFLGIDLNLVANVDVRVTGDLLPTHGFPPNFEIASMGNLGPMI